MSQVPAEAVPPVARDLAKAFQGEGFGLWLVGGWVRDLFLNRLDPAKELDFATDAKPTEALPILSKWSGGKVWKTGIEFGTVAAERGGTRVEVTTFRQEVYREASRNPQVTFAEDLTTDLERRDFTINAMAISLPDPQIIDPHGGLSDLAARRIRTPLGPQVAFSDDPLRMLRALRFASELGFDVDQTVLQAIAEMNGRLQIISRERVRDELIKLLLGASPSVALDLATSTGLADEFLPELPALRLEQDPIHRHKDVFRHTLAVLDNAIALEGPEPDLVLRLAAIMHDIGKPKTRQITPKGVTFHHHEVVGADMTEARLKELRFPSKIVSDVRELVYLHLRFHTYRLGWTDKAVRRYVRDAGHLLGTLNGLVRADCTTRNAAKARQLSERMDRLEERIRELAAREELTRMRPALDGNEVMAHLGVGPGPVVGRAMDFLMEIRMDEGEIDKQDAFRRLDEWAKREGIV